MKIKVIETVTEIEATASEISASQIASLLANALTPYRAYNEEDENDAERREDDGKNQN